MHIDILTLFPEFFISPLSQSILKRALAAGIIQVALINLRDFAFDRHKVTDDRPFGGGPGMVLKIEPLAAAIHWARQCRPNLRVISLSPQGRLFNQHLAGELASLDNIMLVCGHYEGVDDRLQYFVDDEISLGDFILTGGEIPALVILDAVTRLLPGSLGDEDSAVGRFFQRQSVERTTIHPASGICRPLCPGNIIVRRSSTHRPMAAADGFAPDLAATA